MRQITQIMLLAVKRVVFLFPLFPLFFITACSSGFSQKLSLGLGSSGISGSSSLPSVSSSANSSSSFALSQAERGSIAQSSTRISSFPAQTIPTLESKAAAVKKPALAKVKARHRKIVKTALASGDAISTPERRQEISRQADSLPSNGLKAVSSQTAAAAAGIVKPRIVVAKVKRLEAFVPPASDFEDQADKKSSPKSSSKIKSASSVDFAHSPEPQFVQSPSPF